MEVVDENQFRLHVAKTEMDFELSAAELDEGYTDVEELLFQYTPVESFNPYLFDSERVECPLVPSFASRPVSSAPVARRERLPQPRPMANACERGSRSVKSPWRQGRLSRARS